MTVAYFDADGVCKALVSGPGEPLDFPHSAEVPDHVKANEIWFDTSDDTVKPSVSMEVALPDNPTAPFTIDLPPGVIAEVGGVRHTGSVTIDPANDVGIMLSGAAHGMTAYRSYAFRRVEAYPSIGDQLDALWKALDPSPGSEAADMKAAIADVKARIPKPGQ